MAPHDITVVKYDWKTPKKPSRHLYVAHSSSGLRADSSDREIYKKGATTSDQASIYTGFCGPTNRLKACRNDRVGNSIL